MSTSPTTLGAIYALWTADPGLTTASLVLYEEEVPEGTALGSYFVVEDYDESEDILTTTGTDLWLATWDFVGYFVGTAAAETAAALVRTAFNLKALAITSRNNVQMRETNYRVRLDRTRSTDTRRITEARLSYRAMTQG